MTEDARRWNPTRSTTTADTITAALADPVMVPLRTLHGVMDALADIPAIPCPACGGRAFFDQVYLCGDDHEATAFCRGCGRSLLYLRLSGQALLFDRNGTSVRGSSPVDDAGATPDQ